MAKIVCMNVPSPLSQSFLLIASTDCFLQLPNQIPKIIEMDELENILANSIYKQVRPTIFSHFGISCSHP